MTPIEQTVWWHVYPLGFTGAPIREREAQPPAHARFEHLTCWLDYAAELGVTGILLGPIFSSSSHGYDTLDFSRIDPRLGDEEDFERFLAACHSRGLRVLLDGVFSHVGREYPLVQRALAEGPTGEHAHLFDIDWEAQPPAPHVFEGHHQLVRLNHRAPEAVALVQSVLEAWLARGIDGWRLDAAYSVDVAFWRDVIGPVRQSYPDAWFLGELIHGDYAAFVAASGIDSVTQYEVWKATWSSILDRNLFELDHALARHNDLLESFLPNTFIGNHDVTRIASRIGQDGALVALGIVITIGGVPSIYYGDEQGYTGVKEDREGGDDEVRPRYPATRHDLAPWGNGVFEAHRRLIEIRRDRPWMSSARPQVLDLSNQHYRYRVSDRAGEDYLDVEVSLGDTPRLRITGRDGAELWSVPARD